MTEKQLPTADGMRHLREIVDIRHQAIMEKFRELDERNRVQDKEMETLGRHLGAEIQKMKDTLWQFLKWAGGLISATILSVTLKWFGLL